MYLFHINPIHSLLIFVKNLLELPQQTQKQHIRNKCAIHSQQNFLMYSAFFCVCVAFAFFGTLYTPVLALIQFLYVAVLVKPEGIPVSHPLADPKLAIATCTGTLLESY